MTESTGNNPENADLDAGFYSDQLAAELMESCAPHQRALLNVLAVANQFKLDPAPLVLSLANELPSAYRYRAIELAEKLNTQVDAVDALNELPGLLPANCVLALRLARQDGTLPTLYAELVERTPETELEATGDIGENLSKISRVLAISFIVFSVLIFMMLKIIPEFQKMFEEFGIEIPASLELLMSICTIMAKLWFVPVLLFFIAIPFFIPVFRRYLHSWNPLLWRQQIQTPAVNRQRSLALITQTDLPASAGIEMISEGQNRRSVTKRLDKVHNRMESGESKWNAMAAEQIISQRDAKALNLTSDGDMQAWLLRWSALNKQNRHESRALFLTRIFVGVVNVVIGLLVALACISVFMSLIQIITAMK